MVISRSMRCWRIVRALSLLAVAGCNPRANAEREMSWAMADDAVDGPALQVRRGYVVRDWWACGRDGESLRLAHPHSAPLQAWTILCLSRAGVDAVAMADAMLAGRPGDPWALFARAGALVDHPERGAKEGVAAARLALAAMPGQADAVWLLGKALAMHAPRDEAAAFLAAQRPASAEVAALELYLALNDPAAEESRVVALADRVRAADPRSVEADFLYGMWLLGQRRPDEAEVALRRAVALSPGSPALYSGLWQAVRQSGRAPADKRALIDADVAWLLRERSDSPAALAAAANVYEDMAPETYEWLNDDLLARFPGTVEAERARYGRISALERAHGERKQRGAADPAADARLLQEMEAFLASPVATRSLRSTVHLMHYSLLHEDEAVAPEVLLAAVQAWAPHELRNFHMLAEAAAELAARTPYHAEAEAVARLALEGGEAMVAEDRASMPSFGEHDGDFMLSLLHGAHGATLVAQGRRDEARAAFARGLAMKGRAAKFLVQAAAFAESEGRVAEAEALLVEGLLQWRGEELVDKELRALYRRQHGSDRGYAAHRQRLEDGARDARRAALLATRIAAPGPLAPFRLRALGGGEVDSEALRGKVAVLNFWGVSCHPCVAEMPALQQLADEFAGSRDVVIATINIDSETDELAAWAKAHDLRMPVLLGARYFVDNKYTAIPLTLFVDPDGRVMFKHEGATERLREEYTWRIDAIRATWAGVAALRARG